MKFSRFTAGLCVGLLVSGAAYAQDPSSAQTPQTQAANDQVLRDADALMKAGHPAQAYDLLAPLEFARAGEVRFDYLLGIAALDSGKPDKATLAFERVLAVNPNHTAARLDMARAYFQLGDLVRAQNEFNVTMSQKPSGAARATIQKYLDMIIARQEVKQTRITGFIEGALGRDTNVNNSTSQSQITIPSVGNVVATLDPTNVKSADSYYRAAAGGEIAHSLNENWGVYGGADVNQRGNRTRTTFDILAVNGRTGVLYGADAQRVRMGVSVGEFNLGKVRNRRTAGIDGEYHYILSPANQLNVFGQVMQYRYADPLMQIDDFNQNVIGAGWLHAYTDGKSSSSVSLYHGAEHVASNQINPATLAAGRTDGGKRFNGVRLGGQMGYGERTALFVTAGAQSGSYSATNPYFLQQRSDRQNDVTLGALWHWDKLWTLRPQLSYVRNNSNIAIYSYNRADLSLTLRRDFQ